MLISAKAIPYVGLLLVACATPPAEAQTSPAAQEQIGPLYVTLIGDYVGKQLRITVDGQTLVDARLTYPPSGAEHRYDAGIGPAGTVPVEVEIEGCGALWAGELQLEPSSTAYLLFEGCAVEALAPD